MIKYHKDYLDIDNQILIREITFDDESEVKRNIFHIADITQHDRNNDNVEIQVDYSRYIKFRLRDLLEILGFEYIEKENKDEN